MFLKVSFPCSSHPYVFITQMDDITKKTADDVKKLGEKLKEMPIDMRIFSLTLRSLYAEKAVGTQHELAQKFRKLRDRTRDDAMVYLKGILPTSAKFVASISEYFEYYEALKYEQWVDMIEDILQGATGYRELCEVVLKLHEDILVPLKKRQNEAYILVTEFKDLTEEYERQMKELEAAAHTKRVWAIVLCFVPVIGLIANPILRACANSDLVEAIAKSKQAEISQVASITVATVLIPALENFIDGIKKAAGFFSAMEQELGKFTGKADKAQEHPKKLYYQVMKQEAKDMKSICQTFCAVLPDVRTDFLTIPQEGTDQNYVDKWLENQKKTICEKCKALEVAEGLLKAITG